MSVAGRLGEKGIATGDGISIGEGQVRCDWPECPTRGDPWEDAGWCWWPRYYLWLTEGFYCPAHSAFIEDGIRTGYFKNWPRDMSPHVLETLEAMAEFVPLDSQEGQRRWRDADAQARRAGFHAVPEHGP